MFNAHKKPEAIFWHEMVSGSTVAEETSPEFGVYIFYNITFSTFFGQKNQISAM